MILFPEFGDKTKNICKLQQIHQHPVLQIHAPPGEAQKAVLPNNQPGGQGFFQLFAIDGLQGYAVSARKFLFGYAPHGTQAQHHAFKTRVLGG